MIKKFCKKYDITIRELARLLGVPRSTLRSRNKRMSILHIDEIQLLGLKIDKHLVECNKRKYKIPYSSRPKVIIAYGGKKSTRAGGEEFIGYKNVEGKTQGAILALKYRLKRDYGYSIVLHYQGTSREFEKWSDKAKKIEYAIRGSEIKDL